VNLDRFREAKVPLEATQADERRVTDRTNNGGLGKVRESGIYKRCGTFVHANAQSSIQLTGNPEFFIKK